MLIRQICTLIVMLAATTSAHARPVSFVNVKSVVVCDGAQIDGSVPSFTGLNCTKSNLQQVSPHNTLIWMKASVEVPSAMRSSDKPLGLLVSAKAASAFYWNGHLLGRNGFPAQVAEEEIPGRMDTVLFLPQEWITEGENDLVIQMSGHHGILKLANPIHRIMIGPYFNPADLILRRQLPSFVPLGVLIIGALYFGALSMRRPENKRMMLVPLVALFAAGQLIAEASRGVFPYSYPFHDIRLMLILLCASASGICLLLHVSSRFVHKYTVPITAAAIGLAMILVFTTKGFDGKALSALLAPATIGAAISIYASTRKQPGAIAYAIALIMFSLLLFQMPYQFMDIYFYYIVAGLLVFLFHQQILVHSQQEKSRAMEQARADRLQFILDESKEKLSPGSIKVTQPGKVDLVPTDNICFCKGARDYVELVIAGEGSLLHNASLSELEKELPATFLRVHRSYIVNSIFIQSLERGTSGSGSLVLTTGEKVPVSRRIMPEVRKALG